MFWIFFGAWIVVVKGQDGSVVYQQSFESSERAMQVAGKYIKDGYTVVIESKSKNSDDSRIMNFVEGNTNVVTSVNAGSGINVDNTDPANPVVSLPSCSDNQLLMMSDGNWTCVDKASLTGAAGDYTKVTMLSQTASGRFYEKVIEYCDTLTEGGYDDWRLPTPMEFVYLCRITEACGTGVEYWTSELEEGGSTNDVITVYLGTGFFELRSAGSDQTRSFKCVR